MTNHGFFLNIHLVDRIISEETKTKISLSKLKPVLKINLENGDIIEYSSIGEANLSLNKRIGNGSIGEVCNGKRKEFCGFGWKWKT